MEIYHRINDGLERIGGEKYLGLSKEYREFMNMADDINAVILEGGRPGEAKLRGSFWRPGGNLTYRQSEALKQLNNQLPPKMQFWQDFGAWKRGQYLKKYGAAVPAGIMARKFLWKATPDINVEEPGG